MNLNEALIENFMRNCVDIRIFSDHYRRALANRDQTNYPELEYRNLAGEGALEKGSALVSKEFKIGRGGILTFYLVDFWLRDNNPIHRLTSEDAAMDEQLCAATRDLSESAPDLVEPALDYLADLNDDFAPEWDIARAHLDLNVIDWDDWDIAQLTNHLAICNTYYIQARDLRVEHAWRPYQAKLRELAHIQSAYAASEIEFIINVDEDTLDALTRLSVAAATQIVYDHRLPWYIGYPYQGIAELGIQISAHAPMSEVQDALQQLSQAALSDVEQADLETLQTMMRNEETRLFADVFLYPQCPAVATASEIGEYFIENRDLPSTEYILDNYPDEAAIVLVVLGRFQDAADEYRHMQEQNNQYAAVTHCQALLLLADAYSQGSPESWQDSVSQWAIVLADSAYWIEWGHTRFDYYGTQMVFGSVGNLREGHIEQQLLTILDSIVETDEHRRRLLMMLAVEFEAVRLVRALGGIPLRPGRKVWFGPRGMRYFDLAAALGDFLAGPAPRIAGRNRALGDTSPEDAMQQLRWYFSYLALPAILMIQVGSTPHDVIQALENPAYTSLQDMPDCAQPDCPVHGDQPFPVSMCCPDWDQFDEHNPAYRAFDNPTEIMGEDAVRLAVRAYLALSPAYIQAGDVSDRVALEDAWSSALELAPYSPDSEQVTKDLFDLVMDLTQQPTSARAPLDWLTSHINILDIGRALLGTVEEYDRLLKSRLADYLALRALDRHHRADLDGAEADFKRALTIMPHKHELRRNLISIYFQEAIDACHRDPYLSVDFLNHATRQIEEAAEYEGYDYEREKQWIAESRDNVLEGRPLIFIKELQEEESPGGEIEIQMSGISLAYGQAVEEIQNRNYEQALNILDGVLAHNPQHRDLLAAAANAVLYFAWLKARDGQYNEGLDRLYEWEPRLSTVARFSEQVVFYRHWPKLVLCLTHFNDHWSLIHQSRQLRFPLISDNTHYMPQITAFIEDDQYLCFNAALPSFATNKLVQGIKNLLTASGDIVLFKVCVIDEQEIVLRSYLPLNTLNADQVTLSYLKANNFLDLSADQMQNLDSLQARYREIRANFLSEFRDFLPAPAAVRVIERLIKPNRWVGNRVTDVRYRINIPEKGALIQVDDYLDGVSLSLELGRMREGLTQAALLRLLTLNTTLYDCKLTLKSDLVVLSIELPELDEEKAQAAIEKLLDQAQRLRPQLTN